VALQHGNMRGTGHWWGLWISAFFTPNRNRNSSLIFPNINPVGWCYAWNHDGWVSHSICTLCRGRFLWLERIVLIGEKVNCFR
jgi:hypothetical protein